MIVGAFFFAIDVTSFAGSTCLYNCLNESTSLKYNRRQKS